MSEAKVNGTEMDESEQDLLDFDALREQAIDFVKERPWTCVLGAAGLGFLIARLVRDDR